MNIRKTAKAFAIAAVVAMSSQVFAATTNNWWNIDFTGATTITALTNDVPDYPGTWSRAAGDESSIQTNGEGNIYLKLDTLGNNITWTPTTPSTTDVVLVDSDIYLVGSDSAPTGFDTDPGNPVQTAVYLKNYINGQNVTTSSVLCAYVAVGENTNAWVQLEGVSMVDTNWYNVRIVVDYSDSIPVAKFIVDETVLNEAGSSGETEFSIANYTDFAQESSQKVKSVSFRGTGSVDNFVGSQVVPGSAAMLTFVVSTFTDNVSNTVDNVVVGGDGSVAAGSPWNVVLGYFDEAPAGTTNYLTVVRVYTNSTQFVDYDVSFDGSSWDLTGTPFVDDTETEGISYTVATAGLTMGYIVQGYYGADPAPSAEKTVTFDANGGTGTMADQVASTATDLTANTFTRTGYTFTGWNTAANGSGTAYADEDSYAFTADMDLYAQWGINEYTITFDSDGGTEVDDITLDYGATVTPPTAPTKTGYTFTGWTPAVPSTMPLDGETCVAQWDANEYTITFNSDGGSAVSPITQDYGTTVTAPAAPTKSGYSFSAWSPVVPATMGLSITCTAQWTLVEDMTFDPMGDNLEFTSISIAGSIATVEFKANGSITVGPTSTTLWIGVTETLGGTETTVEVEADVTAPAANELEGSFEITISEDTLFVLGISTQDPDL